MFDLRNLLSLVDMFGQILYCSPHLKHDLLLVHFKLLIQYVLSENSKAKTNETVNN